MLDFLANDRCFSHLLQSLARNASLGTAAGAVTVVLNKYIALPLVSNGASRLRELLSFFKRA